MNLHYAVVKDPNVHWPKIEVCYEDGEQDEQAVCPTCGKQFHYNPESIINPVINVFCCWKCIDKNTGPCNYNHKENDMTDTATTNDVPVVDETIDRNDKRTCPECGGPARGRGYTHTEDCPIRVKKQTATKPPCEFCGGPARGRGWIHTEDCELVKKRLEIAAPKRTCPECGGPARGRGYTHTENCPTRAKKGVKVQTVEAPETVETAEAVEVVETAEPATME